VESFSHAEFSPGKRFLGTIEGDEALSPSVLAAIFAFQEPDGI
jgi:hypothetical protein